MAVQTKRHVKGRVLVALVKFLRSIRKSNALPKVSSSAEELLSVRVIASEWYPLANVVELFDVTNAFLLKGNEQSALEMGAVGANDFLGGASSRYINTTDPVASVMALRHAWRSDYDFGKMSADVDADHTVRFTLREYDDIGMVHALMTVGWGVAAARVAGAQGTVAEILERPWRGGTELSYRILCRP